MRGPLVLLLLAATVGAQERVDFETAVLPVLQRSCIECHRAPWKAANGDDEEPRAGLRLDGRVWMMRGSDDGRVLVAGDASKSPLYLRSALPADDPDIMPPKGATLTADELAIFKRWIDEGGRFGSWFGEGAGTKVATNDADPNRRAPLARRLVELSKDATPASLGDLRKLEAAQATVRPVFEGSPLLRVHFAAHQEETEDRQAESLRGVLHQVALLDLSRTRIGDPTLGLVGKMKHLLRLDLSQTKVTSRGLAKLQNLEHLRSLNLRKVALDPKALTTLATLEHLETLYLTDTGLTPAQLAELQSSLPQTRLVF